MATLSNILMDVHRAGGSIRIKWRIIEDIIRRKLGPYVLRRHVIYRCDRERLRNYPWQSKITASFRSYTSVDLIPQILWKRLNEDENTVSITQELSRKAVLWAAFVREDPAAYMLSIKASNLNNWYIRLAPKDTVLYGAGTFREWRGNGLHTDIMRHVIGAIDDEIYCDANEWNTTAQRNFEKCGFVRISTAPKLKEQFLQS